MNSLDDRLSVARGLVSDEAVGRSDRQEATRLLHQVDEALDRWSRTTADSEMATRLMRLRGSLSGHLLAAATLDEAVPHPSNAGTDVLRRAAETTQAGLEALHGDGRPVSER